MEVEVSKLTTPFDFLKTIVSTTYNNTNIKQKQIQENKELVDNEKYVYMMGYESVHT
jgi:hypothetical protein